LWECSVVLPEPSSSKHLDLGRDPSEESALSRITH
jgi:hypothetical protein